jgi:hypothetical protein
MSDPTNDRPLTNEELGLDENGFPPTDETGDVDLEQIEHNLSLTPAERIRRNSASAEFVAAARRARIRMYGFDPADPETTE